MLRLLPISDHAKDAEILALRHQITVLQRQLHGEKVRFDRSDRAVLTALLHRLPRDMLWRVGLLVRPETVLRWHRDLVAHRHAAASRPKRAGRPRTVRSIRTLVLRLARENNSWGYRRIHGELLVLGVKVAASTVWEILREAGIDPAPQRTSENWATFLRSQAEAILAADFFEVVTLTGARMYVLAVIEHASRHVRVLGATADPTAVGRPVRTESRHGSGGRRPYGAVFRPRSGRQVPRAGRRDPRRRRHQGRAQRRPDAPHELNHGTVDPRLPPRAAGPDSDLEPASSAVRPARVRAPPQRPPTPPGISNARPLHPLPEPITDPDTITRLDIRRRDRLGGVLHEYERAA
jgi:putative transposase